VEPSLCVQGLERVFAVGDAVAAGGASLDDAPMTAQVAMQQSEVAAWNIWSCINGQPPVPFRYQHLGNMMGFGRDRGAVTLPLGEGLTLDGEVGGFVRKVAYLYRMPTNEQRLKILSNLARKVGAAARAPQGQ
jgi:NADH:ubiquinone reductase (non-electrogenic)